MEVLNNLSERMTRHPKASLVVTALVGLLVIGALLPAPESVVVEAQEQVEEVTEPTEEPAQEDAEAEQAAQEEAEDALRRREETLERQSQEREQERAQRDRESDAAEAEQIALVEQGYEWFGDEDGRVDIDVDYEVWRAQGAVSSIEGYRVIGNTFIVEVGLHPDNPETEGIARSLCGVASSSLYGTGARRVEVVALNRARLARCDVWRDQ